MTAVCHSLHVSGQTPSVCLSIVERVRSVYVKRFAVVVRTRFNFTAQYKSQQRGSTVVMSDLISTPSQTQSIVSNEAFESLIDLLTSDGIDENPSGCSARTQPNVALRDSSGKLDFDRIRRFLTAQNESHRVSTPSGPLGELKNRIQSPTVHNEDGDSDDEPHSHRSTSSTIPSRSTSMSPKLVERPVTYHRRSSTFGNQPWAAIHENAVAAKVVHGSRRFWN